MLNPVKALPAKIANLSLVVAATLYCDFLTFPLNFALLFGNGKGSESKEAIISRFTRPSETRSQ